MVHSSARTVLNLFEGQFMTEELGDNELLASIYTLFAEVQKKQKLLDELKAEAEKRKLI